MARIKVCTKCGARIQRTVTGTVDDGMAAHYRVVHPGHKLVPASLSEGEGEAPTTTGAGTILGTPS
jgi:hypothetical protein